MIAVSLAFSQWINAPLQCPSPRRPEQALEDSPAETLWSLAERLSAEGNIPARHSTLRFLIERYPNSRFANRARVELETAGVPLDAGTSPDSASTP